jgi:putative ABC transport system permease protein
VLVSVLTEAILLAGLGALIGSAFAWFAFNGNMHSMGGTVIRLTVTPRLIGEGVLFAGCLAFLGALFPAIRGVRLPLATALRAV